MDDMILGVSVLRNKNLANVFYRLQLIEAYGTGVLKILESYDDYLGIKPLIETSDNAFKITLYNTNEVTEFANDKLELNGSEEKIIKLLKEKNTISRKDIEELLNISKAMATNHLSSLLEKNIIAKKGTGKNIVYLYKG